MATVLIVDDDVALTDLGARRMALHGYVVHTAHSCREAFERAKQLKPDIVLLDVMLGDGLGYEVCRAIRRDPELYRMAVVFQSALKDKHEIQHAVEQGGDAYLIKPYSEEALLSKLELMRKILAETDQRDPITGLWSFVRMRREVEHRLAREEDFALCYAWLENMAAPKAGRLSQELELMIKFLAVILRGVVKTNLFYETHLCYAGGLYFLALVPLDERKRFRDAVLTTFNGREELVGTQSHEAKDPLRRLSLQMTYTHTRHRTYTHVAAMLEDLRKLFEERHITEEREAMRANRKIGHDHWVDF